MKKNINVRILSLVMLVLTSSIFINAEERYGILLNKNYEHHEEPGTLSISENNIIFTSFYGLTSESTVDSSELYKEGYFTYLESEVRKRMVFTCEINDVHFLNLVSNMVEEGGHYVQAFNGTWYYTDIKRIVGANWLEAVTVRHASSHVEETINNAKVSFLPTRWNFWRNPWAINKNEQHKKIFFTWDIPKKTRHRALDIDTLVISNGFVMPSKPHLYEENCRAKTIRITVNGKTIERVLEDTPDYQLVPLPEVLTPNPNTVVELEIIDWYEGTKYNDIVIASVSVPVIIVLKNE